MKTTVTLSSDVYGVDTFRYDTLKEGYSGFVRLLNSCHANFDRDGVERELILKGKNGIVYREAKIPNVSEQQEG